MASNELNECVTNDVKSGTEWKGEKENVSEIHEKNIEIATIKQENFHDKFAKRLFSRVFSFWPHVFYLKTSAR